MGPSLPLVVALFNYISAGRYSQYLRCTAVPADSLTNGTVKRNEANLELQHASCLGAHGWEFLNELKNFLQSFASMTNLVITRVPPLSLTVSVRAEIKVAIVCTANNLQ